MATHSHQLPTGWIKIWVTLGLFVTLISIFLPNLLKALAQNEIQRYQECSAGLTKDCKPSLIWLLYEQALQDEGAQGLLMENVQAELESVK